MKDTTTRRKVLTPAEAAKLLKTVLNLPNRASVSFRVKGENDPDDWQGVCGLDYRMTEVVITWDE